MLANDVLATPPPNPTAGMYLDLLRKCVTREMFADTGYAVTPRGHTLKSRMAKVVLEILSRKQLKLVRENQTTLEDKLEGRGWPGTAESMSGSRRLEFFQKVLYVIERDGVRGDFFEGGCWRGGAVIMMLGALRALGMSDRKVWAADSFEGYPAPGPDSTAEDRFLYEQGSYFRISRGDFEANVAKYQLMSDALVVLEGYFDRSLPTAPIDRLALIRIDIDGYEGTRAILENLYPKLSPGGFVVVDDYGVEGARRAIDGYLAEHHPSASIRSIPQKNEKAIYFRKEA